MLPQNTDIYRMTQLHSQLRTIGNLKARIASWRSQLGEDQCIDFVFKASGALHAMSGVDAKKGFL